MNRAVAIRASIAQVLWWAEAGLFVVFLLADLDNGLEYESGFFTWPWHWVAMLLLVNGLYDLVAVRPVCRPEARRPFSARAIGSLLAGAVLLGDDVIVWSVYAWQGEEVKISATVRAAVLLLAALGQLWWSTHLVVENLTTDVAGDREPLA